MNISARSPFYYGKLLASMAKADKRLLNIEDIKSVSILKHLFPHDADEAIAAYHADKNVFWLAESGHCFAASMMNSSAAEKMKILRALWAVAASDGEIHHDEEEFVAKAAREMMASPEDCLEARNAVA